MRTLRIDLSVGSFCRGGSVRVRSGAARGHLRSPRADKAKRRYALAGTLQAAMLISVLISGGILSLCRADACPAGACSIAQVDAAAMVRAVRESEQWIHRVDSLYLRIESVWAAPCACDTAVGAGPRACPPGTDMARGGVQTQGEGQPQGVAPTRGLLEYAFDKSRLRFLDDQPDQGCSLKIWNGKELIAREVQTGRREQYLLDAVTEGNFGDIFASETAWPRSQPHAFWWDRRDVDALAVFFGRPEEFKCVGREKYRDVECHVLEMRPTEVRAILHGESYGCDSGQEDQQEHGLIGEVRGLVDQSCRWYIGVEDGRLRGITWFIAERPRLEHWMSDYREVVPGGWFPMTQGYQVYNKDKDERPYVERRRDLKVVKIEVNTQLVDDLFRLDIREGARVQDKRSGRLVTYEYQSQPADLLGKPLPALDQSFSQLDAASLQGRPVLLCFWDMDQRPSRHCIGQLAGQSKRLSDLGVKIVTVQMAKVDPAVLQQWAQENAVPFPVLGPVENFGNIRAVWNIRSLPWLILADGNHIVRAIGGTLDEVNTQLASIAEQAGRWAAAP
jgi:hypothetical protein